MAPPAPPLQPNLSRGIIWVIVAVTIFVAGDSLAKHLTYRLPVIEIVWARHLFHLVIMLPLLAAVGPRRVIASSRPGLQTVRALTLLVSNVTFNAGIHFLPLGTCTAITFAAPLIILALAALFLGETVGWRQWAAVLVGFAGVLAVVRPSPEGIELVVLFPLATAVGNAFYQLATRALAGRDGPLTTMFWTGMIGLLAPAPALPWVWQTPDLTGWLLLASYGSLGFASHFALILAYRHAPASLLAPFFYVQLVLAMTSGVIFFGNMPTLWDMTGAVLICGSGLYVWHRQRRR